MTKLPVHKERAHALLSASSANRWLACTPSARLEETFPDTTSVYAEEGTLAHELAELKARKHFIDPMGARTFNNKVKKLKENELWQDEMLTYTDAYLDYLSSVVHGYSSPPYIAIEKRLDFSSYVPGGFGTGDCIIIGGDTLHVVDFKYGKGKAVFAEDNPQMKLYALGALSAYSILYDIKKITVVIVQPRLDSISEWDLSKEELLAWGESIKPIAQTAFDGKGEFVQGDHCGFCRAKSVCRARTEFNIAIEDEFKLQKPPTLSNEEVGRALIKAQHLKKWATDLEEYTLSECVKGNEVPGWKAVEGRSNRAFGDIDKAFEVLKADGIKEVMLYEKKPITLTATEKLVGKAKFNELLADYIIKPPGRPTLALECDKREALKKSTAEDDFKNINLEGDMQNVK